MQGLKEFWYLFKQNRGAVIGLFLVLLVALIALLAPVLAPHSPSAVSETSLTLPPFWHEAAVKEFPMGTDDLGRDLWFSSFIGHRFFRRHLYDIFWSALRIARWFSRGLGGFCHYALDGYRDGIAIDSSIDRGCCYFRT